MATARLSPLSSKIGRSCHFRSLAHSFLKWCADCWWLPMSKIPPNSPLIDTPTSWGPFLERRVTRCGKCTYTVWIQPFPLLPNKLFKTRKAAHELLTAVLFAVTWIMGRQAWHMYPSCSVHWVMQAETLHICHVFLLSQVFPPFLLFSSFSTFYLMSTGIAVDKNGLIYFVDGTTIRKVDQNGIISTFLGSNDLTSARPLTCDNSMDINQVTYTHKCQLFTLYAHREHVTAPPCAPAPLALFQFAHPWLIIDMQRYITAHIYIYIYIAYAVQLISFSMNDAFFWGGG